MTAAAADVAKHILETTGPVSTMKLQKLVYYSQAYSLAWTGERMFDEPVRAWTHGPVVYELFDQHRGKFSVGVGEIDGDTEELSRRDRVVIQGVLDALGGLTGWELRNRTHDEKPWRDAFVPEDSRHNREIPPTALREFYAN